MKFCVLKLQRQYSDHQPVIILQYSTDSNLLNQYGGILIWNMSTYFIIRIGIGMPVPLEELLDFLLCESVRLIHFEEWGCCDSIIPCQLVEEVSYLVPWVIQSGSLPIQYVVLPNSRKWVNTRPDSSRKKFVELRSLWQNTKSLRQGEAKSLAMHSCTDGENTLAKTSY